MMKKLALVFVLLIMCASTGWGYSMSGDAYVIESYSDFVTLMTNESLTSTGKYFILSRDIQLAGYSDWPGIGTITTPFNGHFDGRGHTIYVNIWPLNGNASSYQPILTDRALFGYINTASDYAVKNLKVEGSVRGYNAGGIVSVLEAGTITNCSFSGDVIVETRNGDSLIGYLIDELGDDDVSDVDDIEGYDYASIAIYKVHHRGKINAGGIAGVIETGDITECSFRGNVTAEANLTNANAGGIAGRFFEGNIKSCDVEGDSVITASTAQTADGVLACAGGVVGYAVTPLDSVISGCNFDGEVNSTYYAGGIAGLVRGTIVRDNTVSSTADVSATYSAGGIAGYLASGGKISYCYAEAGATVEADSYSAGGIAGLVETSGRGIEHNTSDATIGGSASYKGGIVGALGNNTYSGIAIGDGNEFSGAEYGIGRDEWGKPSNGGEVSYYITPTSFTAKPSTAFTGTLSLNTTPASSVTWSHGTLPDGLTVSTAGVMSWTPSSEGSYSFKAGAYIAGWGNTPSADITITVTSTPSTSYEIDITTTSISSGTQNTAYSATVYASTSAESGTVRWTLASGSLPSGISLTTTGSGTETYAVISGTPTVYGSFTFSLTATLTVGSTTYTDTQAFSLYIAPSGLTITTEALPEAYLRREYRDCYLDSNPRASTWRIISGTLPSGLTLSTINGRGRIYGTPSESGEFTFTVSATSGDLTGEKQFTLVVNSANFTITSPAMLRPGIRGVVYAGETLTTSAAASIGTRVWFVDSGSMPSGLSLGRSNGIISGTPIEDGTFTFRVGLMIGDQITMKTFTLIIIPGDSDSGYSITTSSLAPGIAGREYTQTLTTNAPTTLTPRVWYIDSGNFPSGLELARDTGTISGTPGEAGEYTFTVGLLVSTDIITKTFTLTVIPGESVAEFAITTTSLPPGTEGKAYRQTLSTNAPASLGTQVWYIDEGTLPPGLTLARNTGVISGTPTMSGEYTFRVRLLAGTQITAQTLTLLIIPGLAINIDALPEGKEGEAYSYTLTASADSIVWTCTDGDLPQGLTLNTNGLISGTPTRAGEYSFTVHAVARTEGLSATKTLTLTIRPEFSILTEAALPRGKVGQWYTTTLSADAEDSYFVSWSVIDGALPDGVQLSTNGNIAGTPTREGAFTFTVQATAGGYISAKRFTLIIGSVLEILTESTLPGGKEGMSYECALETDSAYPAHWTLSDGSLPDGLSLSGEKLSGTPTESGTFTFTLDVEAEGLTASKSFTLTISSALVITTPAILPAAKLGGSYSYTLSCDAPAGAEVLWSQVLSSMYDHTDDGSVYVHYYDFPEGMYIEETTGRIYGVPTSNEGVYRIRIRAVMGDVSATKDFTLTVRPTLSITTDKELPHAITNEIYSCALLTDAEESQVVTWSVVSDELPARLTLDEQTGILSGYILNEGTYHFTIQAFSNGLRDQKDFELTAGEIMTILAPEVDSILKAGDEFTLDLQTDKNSGTSATWSIIDGMLPPGLELNASTGRISGSPSRAGTYTFTVQCESGYSVAQRSFTLTVDFTMTDDTPSLLRWTAGVYDSYRFTAEGVSAGAVLWTASRDVLPTGITLNTEGLLSGVTNEVGSYIFTLYAFVSNDVSAQKAVRLEVSAAVDSVVSILTTALPDGKVSEDYYAELNSGVEGVVWTVSGDLPAGLSLHTNGVIDGVPKESGVVQVYCRCFTVRASRDEVAVALRCACGQERGVFVRWRWRL